MNWAIIRKNFAESKWLLISCTLGVAVICAVRLWIVSQIETGNFKQIIEWLPGDLEKYYAVPFTWIITYPGRIALTYQEPIIILCMGVWCLSRASDCVSGELGRGTMEMLLAQPVSRGQLYWSHNFVTICGVIIISIGTWLGILFGIEATNVHEQIYPAVKVPFVKNEVPIPFVQPQEIVTPMREKADVTLFIPAAVNFACFGFMLCGFTALMSSWDRYRWRTIGVVTAFHITQALTKLLALSAPKFSWLLFFTIYSVFEPEFVVRVADVQPEDTWSLTATLGEITKLSGLGCNLILCAFGSIGFIWGARIFQKRDLPAPT